MITDENVGVSSAYAGSGLPVVSTNRGQASTAYVMAGTLLYMFFKDKALLELDHSFITRSVL
jgi:hypothetical protein